MGLATGQVHYVRFMADGEVRYGVLADDRVEELSAPFWASPRRTGWVWKTSQVRLLAPVRPGKIVCVGVNYRAHAQEMGHRVPETPLLFLKPPSAVIGPDQAIRCPAMSELVHYEGEVVAVIGRRLHQASPDEALAAILGYTCGNDVTARDLQRRDGQWTRAKGFDTFAPIGPCIATGLDPSDLRLTTRLNGRVCQEGHTADLVFPVPELVAFISQVMTLEPGDCVFTGTPAGVGPIRPGDRVTVEVRGVGELTNPVE
ncbi:MAG: fumarylacetoacetate hydrolase family protein [Clostridia bacterium]|nr:fumarylacetoacetate hydrolase family protein [Clostridia bacterium]